MLDFQKKESKMSRVVLLLALMALWCMLVVSMAVTVNGESAKVSKVQRNCNVNSVLDRQTKRLGVCILRFR